jgi:lipopolysaccharide/colanic/teichoic acid biosynthesis glycosyltransferase
MAKRLFDITAASLGLILSAPVIVIAAIGVRLSSAGPAFYCAQRVGRDGTPFTLYKLRTMHVGCGSRITSLGDARVFRWGALLRKSKADELPQLWNVVRGDMSLVGPRPEDPEIVADAYGALGFKTLSVRPGLAGVSSLYNYTHGERTLACSAGRDSAGRDSAGRDIDATEAYVERLLPVKLALECVYLDRASIGYDLWLIARTLSTLAWTLTGRTEFQEPPEMQAAQTLLRLRCWTIDEAA